MMKMLMQDENYDIFGWLLCHAFGGVPTHNRHSNE
jgi:hypothetical protein